MPGSPPGGQFQEARAEAEQEAPSKPLVGWQLPSRETLRPSCGVKGARGKGLENTRKPSQVPWPPRVNSGSRGAELPGRETSQGDVRVQLIGETTSVSPLPPLFMKL